MELFTLDAVLNLASDGFMNGISLAKDAMTDLKAFADSNLDLDGAMGDVRIPVEVDPALDAQAIQSAVESAIADGAASGAARSGDSLGQAFGASADALENGLTNAGDRAAWAVANSVLDALNGLDITLDIGTNITGPNRVQRNARAMNSGRIVDNPTIFGYADGAYQVAGDAGPEAVVGVSSLYGMIANAVRGSMPAMPAETRPTVLHVHFEMDRREFGHAVYELNKEETQRVGMTFSNARL